VRDAGDGTVECVDRDDTAVAAFRHRHLGHHADLRVAVAVTGNEQHARLAAGVDGQLHRHAGEHHDVVERNQFEGCHEKHDTLNG
jgi:hypothetical protein